MENTKLFTLQAIFLQKREVTFFVRQHFIADITLSWSGWLKVYHRMHSYFMKLKSHLDPTVQILFYLWALQIQFQIYISSHARVQTYYVCNSFYQDYFFPSISILELCVFLQNTCTHTHTKFNFEIKYALWIFRCKYLNANFSSSFSF